MILDGVCYSVILSRMEELSRTQSSKVFSGLFWSSMNVRCVSSDATLLVITQVIYIIFLRQAQAGIRYARKFPTTVKIRSKRKGASQADYRRALPYMIICPYRNV